MGIEPESPPLGESLGAGRALKRTRLSLDDLIPEYPGYTYENGYCSRLVRGDNVILVSRTGEVCAEMRFLGCVPHRVSAHMPVFLVGQKVSTAYDLYNKTAGCGWITPEAYHRSKCVKPVAKEVRESKITQSGEYIEAEYVDGEDEDEDLGGE